MCWFFHFVCCWLFLLCCFLIFFLAWMSLCALSEHQEMKIRPCQMWLWLWTDFISILHSLLSCQLYCHKNVRLGTASRESYLFSDTFPGVSHFSFFLITFSLFSLPFWMRLLWLMRGPDLSYSTLKAGKWANLGLRIESDVKAIVSTLFRVSSCLGHGALCMCQCTHTQCFENDSFKCTYLLWRTV